MTWTFTSDPQRYAERVFGLLTSDPERNTLPLTVLESVRAGHRFGAGEMLFGWHEQDGEVTGAVSMTPPYGLLLAVLPPGAEDDLVAQLRTDQVRVPEVAGIVADVQRFVQCWLAGTDLGTEVLMRQRLYRLGELRAPAAWPVGSARAAGESDLDLVVGWMDDFRQEAEPGSAPSSAEIYEHRMRLGLLWLWTDEAGEPVAVAGRNVMVAGVSRIGPVYTPPQFRRRGYGAAATYACTRDALAQGAQAVLLFTDLTNPTSNAIYQRLGYNPVDDRVIIRFNQPG
jgi:predicted GNAT family acetyltransferase